MINKKTGTIALIVLVVIIVISLIISIISNSNDDKKPLTSKTIYVATGGGKEDFIADEEVNNILKKEYKLNVVYDSWSNGKTITKPLVREFIGEGNTYIPESEWSVDNDSCSKYDVLFTSDDALKSVDVLSGGERIRILFAKLMLECPNVLIFEDPTNHLDLESITSLNEGMTNFKGNILYSSHDRELLSTVANRIIKFNLDGTWEDRLSNYDDFMEKEAA